MFQNQIISPEREFLEEAILAEINLSFLISLFLLI